MTTIPCSTYFILPTHRAEGDCPNTKATQNFLEAYAPSCSQQIALEIMQMDSYRSLPAQFRILFFKMIAEWIASATALQINTVFHWPDKSALVANA